MLEQLRKLRNAYFAQTLNVGDCVNVALLLGSILQQEFGRAVKLVYGVAEDSCHVWLSVDGIHVDVSTDCIPINPPCPFVRFINPKTYRIEKIEELSIETFFAGCDLEELKQISRRLST